MVSQSSILCTLTEWELWKKRNRKEAAEQYLWDVQYQLEDLEMEIADHDEYLAVARKLIDEAESSEYSDLLDFD